MADRNDAPLLSPYCNWCCGPCRCEQWDDALDELDIPPTNNSRLGVVLAEAIAKAVTRKENSHD